MAVIIFLVMICELRKIADLRGFQCVSESILEFSNYTVYVCVSPLEGRWKVSECARRCSGSVLTALLDMFWIDISSTWLDVFGKMCSTFYLNFHPKLQHKFLWKVYCTQISRLMLLWSLYLWPSVQITAIRLFTCELKLFETNRSAFIIWPCAHKEEESSKVSYYIDRIVVNSELWIICAHSIQYMCMYLVRSVVLSFCTNLLPWMQPCPLEIRYSVAYILFIYVLCNILRET